jgi:hypothetical protein
MSDDVTQRLAGMRERSAAATAGPWDRHDFGYAGEQEPSSIVIHTGRFDHAAIRDGETVIASMAWDSQEDANAEFIAHVRTDLDDLLGAVEDVLGLHAFDPARGEPNSHCDGCRYCQRPWPCPTVAAITARLGGA